MSRVLTTTAANIIVLGLVAMGSAPTLAANYHDYHPWSRPNNSVLVNYHPDTRVRCCSTGAITLIQSAVKANHAEMQRISCE